MAYAAERLGLKLVVFTPRSAPRAKLDYIARHGADLRPAPTYEDAERMAKAFAAETGATYISPYSHPDVIAGAATVAVEILEDWPEVDTILVPVGGGGLVSGIAIAARTMARAASRSWASRPRRRRRSTKRSRPAASSRSRSTRRLPTGWPGTWIPTSITFDLVRRFVDRTVLAPESAIADAIRGLFERGAGRRGGRRRHRRGGAPRRGFRWPAARWRLSCRDRTSTRSVLARVLRARVTPRHMPWRILRGVRAGGGHRGIDARQRLDHRRRGSHVAPREHDCLRAI